MDVFVCSNIGQNDDGVRVEQRRNTDGTLYYRAWTRITHIFGSAVGAAPLEGFGLTEQQACTRLDKALRDFNDSLWA